jgi:hypothetical protein
MLVRRDVLEALDGFDEEFWEGGEDVDLCLRAKELGGKVLLARESAAVQHRAAPLRDRDASLLNRRWLGRAPLVDVADRRAARRPRPGRPALSAVLPVKDALRTVAACAEDLLANLGPDDELVLVDAGSSDGSREFAKLFAKDRGPTVRLVPADPAAGVAGATLAGLAEATRPLSVVVPASLGAPQGFLDELTDLLERHPQYGVLAVTTGRALCAAGPSRLLREVGATTPASLSGSDAIALDAAVRARGSSLLVVRGS